MNITPKDLEDCFYKACSEEHKRQVDISKPVVQALVREYGWTQVLELCKRELWKN
jgi:hypothetical protein